MPDLKEHENHSFKKYEKKFTELHKWMDFPVKAYGFQHRKFRHDPDKTPKEAKELFGKNADHACLDHIILDLREAAEKKKTKMTNPKTRLVGLRIPNQMMRIVFDYAKTCHRMSITKTILFFMNRGILSENLDHHLNSLLSEQKSLIRKIYKQVGRYSKIKKEEKNLVFERDDYKCRKCGSLNNLIVCEISSDINELEGNESKITLCKNCKEKVEKFIPRRYKLEAFLEWYFES